MSGSYIGIDEEEDETGAGVEAVKQVQNFRVIYQNNNYLLPQLVSILKDREIINIRPEYQRRLRWTNKKKSALIESLILNIPIPPVYFYENEYATYEVMDGQQRLNAILEFFENQFSLSGLTRLTDLNSKRYHQLDRVVQRTLDRASVSAIVLLIESSRSDQESIEIRKEVFGRLNTGGQKLNAQEVRNAIYRGIFNDMIVGLTRDSNFTKAWSIPPYTETDVSDYYDNDRRQKNALYKTMGDCQIILRFFTFCDEANIRGSVTAMLDRYADAATSFDEEATALHRKNFLAALEKAMLLRGDEPFQIAPSSEATSKSSIPFSDALMVALHRTDKSLPQLEAAKDKINERIRSLTHTEDGFELLIGRANTAETIKGRIDAIANIIQEEV